MSATLEIHAVTGMSRQGVLSVDEPNTTRTRKFNQAGATASHWSEAEYARIHAEPPSLTNAILGTLQHVGG